MTIAEMWFTSSWVLVRGMTVFTTDINWVTHTQHYSLRLPPLPTLLKTVKTCDDCRRNVVYRLLGYWSGA